LKFQSVETRLSVKFCIGCIGEADGLEASRPEGIDNLQTNSSSKYRENYNLKYCVNSNENFRTSSTKKEKYTI